MCYAYGSVDQAVNVCPMCKVFPHPRCPHQRDICRNRKLHPRHDVLYLKNAEVESFNGCGYCKWALSDPPPKQAGYLNQGWPGCCRPPAANEYRLIQAADWRSVSIVHGIPIPPEIKTMLDNLGRRGSPVLSGSGRIANAGAKPSSGLDRRHSNSSPSRSGLKSSPVATVKGRSNGSPKQDVASLASHLSHSASGSTISSSPSNPSPERHIQRKNTVLDSPDKTDRRVDGSHSSHSSPSRRVIDLEGSGPTRRHSTSRTPPTPSIPLSRPSVDARSQINQSSPARRGSLPLISTSTTKPASPKLPVISDRTSVNVAFKITRQKSDISSASSSSGSSDSNGSLTDSTITSEGFTDYLSDESEAELQRQAEARAALVAQMQAEEMEFKAARQQLALVDLHPPRAWNPHNLSAGRTAGYPSHATQTQIPTSSRS